MQYELVVVVDPTVEEKQAQEKLTALLAKEGFSISGSESLGKKPLAYPISKKREGLYLVLTISGKGNPATLTNRFKTEEYVLRSLVVKK